MNINKEIEKYIVHLKFRDNNGSGVLFKANETSEYCYLFTAKHNFEKEDEYGNKEFFSPFTYHNDFEIVTSNFSQLKIESVVEIEDELGDIDLLILSIKNYNYSCWKKIKPLKVFSGDLKKDMDCIIGGFPAIHEHHLLELYACNFIIDNSDYTLEVESKRLLSTAERTELETNRGISGGGLFVQGNDNKIYLLGMEIEFKPRHNLKCINLQEIIDIVNNKISSSNLDKIITGGYPLLDKYSLSDMQFDLSLIETELENDYIKEVKCKSIEFLRDKSEKVNKNLHDRYSKVLLEMKDLANSYLYRGAIFNGKYNQLATINLKKAIQLNEDLEIYLAQAKYVRTKDNAKRIDDKSKRDNKFQIDILKGKILETDNIEELKKLYIDLLFYLNKYQDFYQEDITIYQKKLIDEVYIEQLEFKEAERILENSDLNKFLDRKCIRDRLFKIYFHSKYLTQTKLSKKEFSEKLFDLLARFEFESKEYLYIKEKLKNLSIFDDKLLELNENLIKSKLEFEEYKQHIHSLDETVYKIREDANENNKSSRFLDLAIYFILGVLVFNNNFLINIANNIWDKIVNFFM